MIKILLVADANVNAQTENKITPLMLAIHGLEKNIISSDYDDYYKNNIKIIALLGFILECGANPNISDENGVTLLMQCVSLDNYYKYDGNIILAMKLLINHGADVNTRDNNGNTPLMYVAKVNDKYHADVIKNLLASGVAPSMKNNDGESVIEILLNTFWGDSDNDNDDENILQRASLHFSPEDFIIND